MIDFAAVTASTLEDFLAELRGNRPKPVDPLPAPHWTTANDWPWLDRVPKLEPPRKPEIVIMGEDQ